MEQEQLHMVFLTEEQIGKLKECIGHSMVYGLFSDRPGMEDIAIINDAFNAAFKETVAHGH